MIKLEHPTAKHQVTIRYANWKVSFIGVIWFFWHRDWGDGIFYWFTMFVTLGFANFVWPFIAEKRLAEHYQQKGYKIVDQMPRKGWEAPLVPFVTLFITLFALGSLLGILRIRLPFEF